MLGKCATLYNAALEERREAYSMSKVSVSLYDQMKQLTEIRRDDSEWADLDAQIGRGVLLRLDRAFNAFFRRVKEGSAPGYPRFRSRTRYTCIDVAEPRPGMVKQSPGGKVYIRIKGLPIIKLKSRRCLPDSDHLRTLRINLKPNGIMVDLGFEVDKEPLSPETLAVGLDAGVHNRLALSDGTFIESRKIDRRRERRLHRAVSRSKKGSNTRRKRVALLRKEKNRQRVSNRNECHRMTTALVRRYGHIAVESLNIKNMTRSASGTVEEPGKNVAQKRGLNRSITDQTWGLIRQQLAYKAEWAGRQFTEVDPKYTSQTCSVCGVKDPDSRISQASFKCTACGYVVHADTNAARNVLRRARFAQGRELRPGSGKPSGFDQKDSLPNGLVYGSHTLGAVESWRPG